MGWQSLAVAGALPVLRAQSASAHRALVCIYLSGGNDSNNLLVPLDPASYNAYAAARGPLAIPTGRLLPITSRGQASYGLHPALTELADLYGRGKMAVVANVGGQRPGRIGAHTAGADMSYLPNGFLTPQWAHRWAAETGSAEGAYTFESGISMLTPGSSLYGSGLHENTGMRLAIDSAAVRLRFPNTGIGTALREVAALASIAGSWGMSRQVFTVPVGGFDTHSAQLPAQHRLFRQLSQATAAFYRAADEMGMANNIAVYTDSEFNRSLTPNKSGGTDHGWGGHQFVVGGSVRGGDVYGEFPTADTMAAGVWAPTISRSRYAGEFGAWAGAPSGEPGLGLLP
jgi:uncharacterized protein (DUF1501 family)